MDEEKVAPEVPSTPSDSETLAERLERLAVNEIVRRAFRDTADPADCAKCEDAGFVLAPLEPGRLTHRPEPCPDCAANEPIEAMLRRRGVPQHFTGATLEDMPESKARAALERWLVDGDRAAGIVLHGPPGTGKTTLAVAFLRGHIESGGGGRFIEVARLLDEIRRRFGDAVSDDAVDYFASWLTPELLILDDLGAEKPSPWTIERITRLVNDRQGGDRRTLITTNVETPEALDAALGYRITDRLTAYAWIFVGGDSFRVEQGALATEALTGEKPQWWAK